jgi:hypothetical protein
MDAARHWIGQIEAASREVEAWIRRVDPHRWQAPGGTTWTNQDLLGHLAAWSDLLVDQVEALQHDRPDTIETVDVDQWNAVQVEKRRGWTTAESVEEWEHAARRAADVVGRLPAEAGHRKRHVAWSVDPVSIDQLLRLWFVHLDQHRSRMIDE